MLGFFAVMITIKQTRPTPPAFTNCWLRSLGFILQPNLQICLMKNKPAQPHQQPNDSLFNPMGNTIDALTVGEGGFVRKLSLQPWLMA
jgi:hypothetical protein